MSDFYPSGLPEQYVLPQQKQEDEDPYNLNLSAPRERQVREEGYRLPITDSQNDLVNQAVLNYAETGGDPEEMKYKMASAIHYSRLFDLPLDVVLDQQNYDAINKYYIGSTGGTAKSNWEAIVSAWKSGTVMLDFNEAARQWKNTGGSDPELEKKADALYAQMDGLKDSLPRPWAIELIKAGAESLPFTIDVMASTLAGQTAGTAGAIAAAGAAGLAIGATGGLGSIPIALIAAFGSAAGMSMGLSQSVKDQEGIEYYRLRKLGVGHDVAAPVAGISSNILGLIEVGLGTVPQLASSIGGKSAVQTLTAQVMKKIGTRNILGPVARAAAGYVGQGIEEGMEEALQQIVSNIADIVAADLQGAGAEQQAHTVKRAIQDAGENFIQGAMASIMLGIPGTMISWRGNVAEAESLNKMAGQEGLELEDFIRFAKKESPSIIEGMTEADQNIVLTKIWESQQARQTAREKKAPAGPATEEQVERAETRERPSAKTPTGGITRLETGRLYTTEETTLGETSEGITEGRMLVGDPTAGSGRRYGYINFTEEEGSVTIDSLRTDYDSIRRDMILELAARKPGKQIIWNPRSEAMKTLKADLIKANPRGDNQGLQWFETEEGVGDLIRMADIKRKLSEVAPQIREELQDGFISLVTPIAKASGQTLDQFMGRVFTEEMFTNQKGEQLVAQGKRGGTSYDQELLKLEGKYKALVYLTKNSDFTTLTHEFFHAIEPHLSEEDKKALQSVYGDDKEGPALDWEKYHYSGKAPTPELQSLFSRIAKWFREVYQKIKGAVDIDPRITKVFERIYSGESLKVEAEQQQTQQPEGGNMLFQPSPPVDSEAFKTWFKDSEIVNADGSPKIVYHGTGAQFEVFNPFLDKNGNELIFFAENLDVANYFRNRSVYPGQKGKILEVYLSVQKLFTSDNVDELTDFIVANEEEFKRDLSTASNEIMDNIDYSMKNEGKSFAEAFIYELKTEDWRAYEYTPALIKEIRRLGYDGIRVYEDGSNYAVFSPTQVKSIQNVGTFDPENPSILYQSAWHGTGANFKKFSTDYIGTGEGAQAYGWGIYATENKDIGISYANTIGTTTLQNLSVKGLPLYKNGSPVDYTSGNLSEFEMMLTEELLIRERAFREDVVSLEDIQAIFDDLINYANEEREQDPKYFTAYLKILNKYRPKESKDIKRTMNAGRYLYSVNLPDNADWIEWGKPIKQEQVDKINKYFTEKPITEHQKIAQGFLKDKDFSIGLNDIQQSLKEETGESFYRLLATAIGSDKDASIALSEAGITGNKYPAGSMGTGDGSNGWNYVIFNDKDVSIESSILFQSDPTDSPDFQRWFEGSKVVDEDGEPIVMYHGTTHAFEAFDPDLANPENDMGKGIYLSSSYDDVATNYEGEGPDLTNRIERLAEQIEADEEIDYEEAKVKARERLYGGEDQIIEAYAAIKNPIIIGGNNETFFDYEEEYDEETDEYGEPTGSLLEFIESLRAASEGYEDVDIDSVISVLMETAIDDMGFSASDLIEVVKTSEGLSYAQDEAGNLVNTEIIRAAFQDMGYDGIIDYTVYDKFGPQRKGKAMQGVYEDTFHAIAFYPNQIKSVDNHGTWNADDDRILYQSDDELMNEARTFDDWKEWRAYHEALTPDEEMSAEERAADNTYYKKLWNDAQKPTQEDMTPEGLDDQYITDMAEAENLQRFEAAAGYYLEAAKTQEQPADEAERTEFERVRDLADRIETEAHTTFTLNALAARRGKTITPRARKQILTLMKQAPRAYRALYAEVMQDDKYSVPEGEETVLPEIERPKEPKTARMSITERLALGREFQNADIAKRLRSGELVVNEELQQYIDSLQTERSTLEKKIETLQESVRRGDQVIRYKDKQSAAMQEDLNAADKERQRLEKQVQDLEIQGRKASETLIQARDSARIKYEDTITKLKKKAAGRAIIDRLLKNREISDLKAEMREKESERRRVQKVKQYFQRYKKRIMKKPSNAIAWEQREIILDTQARLDPNPRRMKPGEEGVIEGIRKAIAEDKEYEGYVTPRLMDMATKRNLSNMSLNEVEALANFIDSVARYGRFRRQLWKFQRDSVGTLARETITQTIEQSGKYVEPPAFGSEEEKKQRKGVKSFLRAFDYSFINLERKAIMLDGGVEGENHKWLVKEERKHRRAKLAMIKKRTDPIFKRMEELGLKIDDMFKQHTISNAGPRSGTATYTSSDLMFAIAAARNGYSKEALSYGDLVSDPERRSMTNEDVRFYGDARLSALLDYAEKNLTPAEREIMDMILADYENNYNRTNNVCIEEFNIPMGRQANYIHMHRREVTYDDLRAAMADDLLDLNAGGLQRLPKSGFKEARIKIQPKNQKPIDMDLFGGWLKSVEQTEHFINYTGYIREVNGIYKRNIDPQGVRGMITGAYGKEMMDSIDDAITELANPSAFIQRDTASKFLRGLRGDLGAAYLGWKLSSITTQIITSPMPFLGYVNPLHLTTAYLRVMSNPIKAWNDVSNKSDIMRTRSMDVIQEAIRQWNRDNPTRKMAKINALGMKGLEWADRVSVVSGWIALYEQELGKNGGNEEAAIEYADSIVLKTQPSGQAEDLSPAFKTKQEAWRVFLQFQSQLNIIWQNIRFDLPTAIKNQEYGRAIGIAYSYMVAGALLGLAKEGFDKKDDDRDKALNMLYWSMTQFSDSVPLLGSAFTTVMKSAITGESEPFFESKLYPAANTMLEGMRKLTQEEYAKALENFGYSAGYFIGLPVSGVKDVKRAVDSKTASEAVGKLIGRRD